MASPRTAFCIPVFEDWASVRVLLGRIGAMVKEQGLDAHVLLVDDCSHTPAPDDLATSCAALQSVHTLRLRRNLGHQRAIAIGLTHLYDDGTFERVVVMDGDGEDAPEDVPKLLALLEDAPDHAVFAKRARRSESIAFRVFYQAYKIFHRVLTGRRVEVGNFSVVPRAVIARLVATAEMWNHYAAAVYISRAPILTIPVARSTRIAGTSQMSFVSLAAHGLGAISVYSEVIGVRLLIAASALLALSLGGLGTLLVLWLQPGVELPPWTALLTAALLPVLLNALLLAVVFAFLTLQGRNAATFLPLRDWRFYVDGLRVLHEHPDG